jgi:hypothetical protein
MHSTAQTALRVKGRQNITGLLQFGLQIAINSKNILYDFV